MSDTAASPKGRPPRESRVEMTEIVLPSDSNALGTIFGGRVMQWIDIAGAVAARRHARSAVVTAGMDELHFHVPIRVGAVAVLEARVLAAFRTSMEVAVTVHSEELKTGVRTLCTSAFLTFVALDENGRPREVPPVAPETEEERLRMGQARQRRELRLAHKALRRLP
jgi:acyl-CoA hydrolase